MNVNYNFLLKNVQKVYDETQRIEAGATPILFHYTTLSGFAQILKSNAFLLTSALGTEAETRIDSRMYYFSLTRSRLGNYHVSRNSGVLLTLDGTKLNHNYKIKPIDYWGQNFRDPGRHEMEDRLVSNKPKIDAAISYILKIDVLNSFDLNDRYSNDLKRNLKLLLLVSKKYGIPLYFYATKKDWLTSNTKNALHLDLKSLVTKPKIDDTFKYTDRSKRVQKTERSYIQNLLDVFRVINSDLTPREKWQKLDDYGQGMVNSMVSSEASKKTMYSNIISEIQDAKQGSVRPKSLERLTALLASQKISLSDFYSDLALKWQKLMR